MLSCMFVFGKNILYNYYLNKTLLNKLQHKLFKYNSCCVKLIYPPLKYYFIDYGFDLHGNKILFNLLIKKPFANAVQFYIYNNLYKPTHIKLLPAVQRLKKKNIYNKFLTVLMRRGLKKKLINSHSRLFLFWFLFKWYNTNCEILNYNLFYRNYMFTFLKSMSPLLTLESIRIDKRKRKALRLKHRFNYKIQYLPVYRRMQIIYKWLHLELLDIKKRHYIHRLQILYTNVFKYPNKLILYKLRHILHTKLFKKYISKRV